MANLPDETITTALNLQRRFQLINEAAGFIILQQYGEIEAAWCWIFNNTIAIVGVGLAISQVASAIILAQKMTLPKKFPFF